MPRLHAYSVMGWVPRYGNPRIDVSPVLRTGERTRYGQPGCVGHCVEGERENLRVGGHRSEFSGRMIRTERHMRLSERVRLIGYQFRDN